MKIVSNQFGQIFCSCVHFHSIPREYVALRSTLSQRGGAKFVDEWVIRSEGRTPSKSPEPKYLGENARQQSPRAGAMFVDDWVVRTEVNRARSKSAGKGNAQKFGHCASYI